MGFGDFETFNMAMLAKQAWRLMTHLNLLVSKLLKAKYFPHSSILNAIRSPNSSFAWQSILYGAVNLKQGVSINEDNYFPQWTGDSSGKYTVKSGYSFFLSLKQKNNRSGGETSDSSTMQSFWARLWKTRLPSKIKIFAWKLYHNGIPCAENLYRRGCTVALKCQVCGAAIESSIHIFRDC